MPEFATRRNMFNLIVQKLPASVISDILDVVGFCDQVRRATIRPLYPGALVVGQAMPGLYAEVFAVPEKPDQMEMEAEKARSRAPYGRGTDKLTEGTLLRDVYAQHGEL
jgi:hypothetical protein